MPRSNVPSTAPYSSQDEAESSDASKAKMRAIIQELSRRWYWALLGLILGILGALHYLAHAPRTYAATATLLVKESTNNMLSGGKQSEKMDLKGRVALNTIVQRIKRIDLLTAVAEREEIKNHPDLYLAEVSYLPDWAKKWMGKDPDATPEKKTYTQEELVQQISNWTGIQPRQTTRLVDIRTTHRSPEVAKLIADAIVQEYGLELSGARASGRDSSYEILLAQSESVREQLQQSQNALANYESALGTLDTLAKKEEEFAKLALRYLPKHPRFIRAKSELTTLQERFLSEFDQIRKSPADRDYWEKAEQEFTQTGDDPNARLQTAKRLLTARSSVLESEIDSSTEVFNSLLTRLQETDINQEGAESEVEVSNLALLPNYPLSPKKSAVMLGGGALGFLGGLGLAAILMALDRKIHSLDQVTALTNLPIFATINRFNRRKLNKLVSNYEDTHGPIPEAQKQWSEDILLRDGLTSTTHTESFRVLRVATSLLGDTEQRPVTLFSSAIPGEGKTFVSTNFALSSARQGKKTLLIDLDLRKPSIHTRFGLERDAKEFGVADILAGRANWQDCLLDVGQENLDVILAGAPTSQKAELVYPEIISDLLKVLSEHYYMVVVDSAPLLAVSDTRAIIPAADNFCLVVRAESTPKGAVKECIALLEEDGSLPDGVVVNGFTPQKKVKKGYGYGQYGKVYGSDPDGVYGADQD